MTITPSPITSTVALHHVQTGDGPDVLLLSGLGDAHDVWQAQLQGALPERYRMTAPDNRGTGRTPLPPEGITIPAMADDAAALLRDLGIGRAHVAGFSMGGAIAQELALRHPDLVRSLVLVGTYCRPDAMLRRTMRAWSWLASVADDPREFLSLFTLSIYTRRAHADGLVDELIEAALNDPLAQDAETFRATVEACAAHDTAARLAAIDVPTLVLCGDEDAVLPPRFSREIALRIPDARLEVLTGEAHQPFQESPAAFDALVDAFWREVDA